MFKLNCLICWGERLFFLFLLVVWGRATIFFYFSALGRCHLQRANSDVKNTLLILTKENADFLVHYFRKASSKSAALENQYFGGDECFDNFCKLVDCEGIIFALKISFGSVEGAIYVPLFFVCSPRIPL
jgi:hypothetical protein